MTDLADKTSLSQATASDPRKSAWVSANAGSGKTHVLVNRIIRLMLEGADPGKILALTFTKAAAAEMANRLSGRLAAWAMLDADGLGRDIAGITGTPPSPAQLIRARRLFAHALETPGGLKIQTIHAFCERVLHRFALEANVAPNFEILDERTSAELLNDARERVFENLEGSRGAQILDDLKIISAALNVADFNKLISQIHKRRTLMLAFHRAYGGMDRVIANLRQVFGLIPEDSRDSILAQATGSSGPVAGLLPGLIELFNEGTENETKKADKLTAMDKSNNFEERFELYKSLFLTADGSLRKQLITKKLAETHPDKKHFLEDEQKRIAALDDKLVSLRIAEHTGALLRIADKILAEYETAKISRALLDYDDLIQRTAGLLSQTEAAAWVLYKLDNGIDHILVDEAQDTSPEQWQVISALSNEFFAGAGAGTTLRTVFAVGDEKQSIFGFQGASPEEFDTMRRHFQRRAGFVEHDFEKVELTVSFRSTRQILEAVDQVFACEMAARGMTSFGATPVHEAFRQGHAGVVEIWPPEMPGEVNSADPWDAPLDYAGTSSPQVRLAHRIATAIRDWITSKEILSPRGRPVRAGDILILVRRRNNFVDAMVDALKTRGVAVAGIDRMHLSRQLAIMDLLALARFVLLPQDDLNLATVLKGPLVGLDDDDLFDLAYKRKTSLWRTLATLPRFSHVYDYLNARLSVADTIPPFEFFSQILNASGGRQKFIRRMGLEVNDPLDEFLSLCLNYEKTSTPSLQGFVAWFGAADVEAKRDMEHGRDEVRIMTVHGAKGLEANIVILPDTCHRVPDSRKQANILTTPFTEDGLEVDELLVWRPNKTFENDVVRSSLEREQQAETEEYNRLLYVAMTRARDRLYIAGYEGRQSSSERSWYHLVSEILKPRSEEIRDAQGNILCWRIEGEQKAEPVENDERDCQVSRAQVPPDWALRPVKPEPQHIDLVSPSQLSLKEGAIGIDGEAVVSEFRPSPLHTPPEERYLRGRLIHKLLEYAPGANRETYPHFCLQFLQRTAPSFSAQECTRIADDVQRVLDTPEFATLFDTHGLSEVPVVGQVQLAGRDQPVKVSGRIDRLIIRDSHVLVIDFKTDRTIPDSPETIPARYLYQMAIYRHLLTEIFPNRQIICHLLWTTGPELMELPETLLSCALE